MTVTGSGGGGYSAGTSSEAGRERPLLLLVAPYFRPAYYGGAVQLYLGLIRRMTRFRVVVASDRAGSDAAAQQEFDSRGVEEGAFTVVRIPAFELHWSGAASGWRKLGEGWRFWREGRRAWRALLRQVRPDVVVCGGTLASGWLLQRLPRRVPVINYIHGEELTMTNRQRWWMRYLRRCQRRLIRRADLNIAVSEYTARTAKRLAKVPERRIVVLPNSVDTGRFHRPADREGLREKMGWSGKLVVLTVARLDRRKGLDQGLRALALLAAAERIPPEWVYAIGGRGPEQLKLEALTAELGMGEHVQFLGFVADDALADVYGAADIFLMSNREIEGDTEGFGIVFLEASACGLPVIGGTAGGTGDAIEEGVSGFRVNGEDVNEIARALDVLANDADLRRSMGEKGEARVRSGFNAEAAAARFEEVVSATLQARGARS